MSLSCRRNASCIAGLFDSHRCVEPSMSLNKNVTVPVGSAAAGLTPSFDAWNVFTVVTAAS